MNGLIRRLRAFAPEGNVLIGEMMKDHTSFRIGGPADIVFLPSSGEDILAAIAAADECGVPRTVLGNGSNVLVRDGGIRGLVIVIGEGMSRIRREGNTLIAQAGAALAQLARRAQAEGLGGLAFAGGIPGSVGGGTAMNAGAYDGEIKQVLSYATVIMDGRLLRVDADSLHLTYRDSDILKNGYIVTEAEFALTPGDPDAILEEMNELNRKRREKQPLNLPSAGSFFKRPDGYFAGALIEQAGLKGYRVGGAQVSEKHAGFVVNAGGATAADVIALMEYVQDTVHERFGVTLQPEVRIIGEPAGGGRGEA